jgi:inhibitor of cysteine peptidase
VLSGVTITLSGAGSATTTTNASGNYSFPYIVDGSYTVTPSLTGYTFSPTNAAVSIDGADITITNFAED